MTRSVKVAVVGAGRIAAEYGAVLRELRGAELAAVVDVDEAARTRAEQELEAPVFASLQEMLAATEPEAAFVLTPPGDHEAVSTYLLQHDVHVLCEKPIATSAAAAQRMFRVAHRARRLLMMASKFRYVRDVLEARRLIVDGALGEVVLFENVFCSKVDMAGRWNADPRRSGGGVLIDNGAHSADLVCYLIGPIVRVFTVFGRRVQDLGVEDTVRMLVETEGGRTGVVDLSWSVHRGLDWYASVAGSRGVLHLGWRESRLRDAATGEWRTFGRGYDKREAFRRQIANFLAAVRGEEQPAVGEADALHSARVVDAAYRSARAERWVPVPMLGEA